LSLMTTTSVTFAQKKCKETCKRTAYNITKLTVGSIKNPHGNEQSEVPDVRKQAEDDAKQLGNDLKDFGEVSTDCTEKGCECPRPKKITWPKPKKDAKTKELTRDRSFDYSPKGNTTVKMTYKVTFEYTDEPKVIELPCHPAG
jgi:hypothetical protein